MLLRNCHQLAEDSFGVCADVQAPVRQEFRSVAKNALLKFGGAPHYALRSHLGNDEVEDSRNLSADPD